MLRLHSTQHSENFIYNLIFQVIPHNHTQWSLWLIKTELRTPLDSAKKSSQILGFKISFYNTFSCLLLHIRSRHAILYMNNEKVQQHHRTMSAVNKLSEVVHNDYAVGLKLNTTVVHAFHVLDVLWNCYCVYTYTDPELLELSSIWLSIASSSSV